MSDPSDRRSTLRREINSLGMRGGEAQESKIFATVGKCLCIWLIWKHADILILHYEALLVLLVILVAPDLFKKLITMKYGGERGGFTEHTERTERSVTAAPNRVDVPS